MGEVEAKKDMVTRHDLRHDRHTVSLLTDHLVFSPKYRGKVLLGDVAEVAEEISWIAKRIKGRSSKQTLLEKAFTEKRFAVRDRFQHLKEWCPGHLWAPSCYHGSVGHGWEVVERYISGQRGYEKADTAPVIAEEKKKAHKTWYTSLYNKLFGGKHQK
jgi:putative transposase